MLRSTLSVLLVAVCCLPVLAQTDLLVNGQPSQLLDPRKVTGTEEHAAVFMIPLRSNELPGWTVTRGRVFLDVWKGGGGSNFAFRDSGAIAQSIATIPERQYRVRFALAGDPEGGPIQGIVLNVAGHVREYPCGPHSNAWQEQIFTAGSETTRLEFSFSRNGLGGRISKVSVSGWNPAAEALRPALEKVYLKMEHAKRNLADLPVLMGLLTDDFTVCAKGGEPRDRAAFEAEMKALAEKSPLVTATPGDITPTKDGAIVFVDRRVSYEDAGRRKVETSRTRDTWVRQGDDWKLKSSEEI